MAKVLVLFDSNTGHTAKMAEYVAEGCQSIEGIDVRLKNVSEADKEDLIWCDGLALGSPTNYGTVSWKMKKWWDELPADLWATMDGKIGCSFSSSGGIGGGSELTCMTLLTILMNYGFLVFGVTDYITDDYTLHYGSIAAKAPRAEHEIESCRRLGQRLSEWVIKYMG